MAEDKAKKKEVEKALRNTLRKKKLKPDEEGRYYDRSYGGYITPMIWAAISPLKPPTGQLRPARSIPAPVPAYPAPAPVPVPVREVGQRVAPERHCTNAVSCDIQDKSSKEQAVGLIANA